MIFTGIMFFGISFYSSRNGALFKNFGMLSIIGASFQFFTLYYITSIEVQQAQFWLKLQSLSITVFLPLYIGFICIVSKHPARRKLINYATVFFSLSFLVKFLYPDGLRYQVILGLKQIELPWGERIHLLYGHSHYLYYCLLPVSLFVIFWGLWRGIQMIRQDQQLTGVLFCTLSGGFILSSLVNISINKGWLDVFPLGGFFILLFVIMACLEFAKETYDNRLRLQASIQRRKDYQDTLVSIAKQVNEKPQGDYFESMVLNMQSTLKVRFAMIGILNGPNEVLTQGFARAGRLIDNIHFGLDNSPLQEILQGEQCIHPSEIQSKFPHNSYFLDNHIQSYIGVPLRGDQQKVIGFIALMDSHSIPNPKFLHKSLEIYSAQISAELKVQDFTEQLERLAYYDYLTQLPNRARLHMDLEEVFNRSQQHHYSSALLYVDLDNFKDINDFMGSEMADHLLMRLAQRFNELNSIRLTPYRLTGDEFIFILENTTKSADITQVADKIHQVVATPFVVGDNEINIVCSIGVVQFPTQATELSQVLGFAETALNEAKEEDGRSTKFFDPKVQESLNFKEEIEHELKMALSNHQIQLFFQPQLDSQAQAFGAEVLVRWQHAELGFISPATFIPIAESSGLIHPLGDWILEHSIKQAHEWYVQETPVPPHLSINVSAWQFNHESFITKVQTYLERYPVPTSWIVLELTETAIVDDVKATKDKLIQLREMGLSIALDDFGTGYSSLAYVKDLPLDYIKIDKAFVDQIFEEGGSGIVETIISMGKHMNLKIIAEGTETLEQIDKLKSYGCKLFQGYYYSKPIPLEDYQAWAKDKLQTPQDKV